jgi:hypothetical protein
MSSNDDNSLAYVYHGSLELQDIQRATKQDLENYNWYGGNTTLYRACGGIFGESRFADSGVEVVQAILDKDVDIDGLSNVNCHYYYYFFIRTK